MTQLLDCVTVEHNPSKKTIDKSVIWLHGLGASGHDFAPVIPQLGLKSDLAIRFVFPHAPRLPITINGGMVMPAWYDIKEISLKRSVDVVQLEKSSDQIKALMAREGERGVATENIVLAGFSQGGAVAYHVALTYPQQLAGVLALSTYLAVDDSADYTEVNKNIPIKIDHGIYDPVVPLLLATQANDVLTEKGYNVDFTTYPMLHQVCPPQLITIGKWFNKVLGE